MDKAAYELLEGLKQAVTDALYREHCRTNQGQMKFHIEITINNLNELLDKARHEQKGGA